MRKSDWWSDWHEHPNEKRRDENSNVANEKTGFGFFHPKSGVLYICYQVFLPGAFIGDSICFLFFENNIYNEDIELFEFA